MLSNLSNNFLTKFVFVNLMIIGDPLHVISCQILLDKLIIITICLGYRAPIRWEII